MKKAERHNARRHARLTAIDAANTARGWTRDERGRLVNRHEGTDAPLKKYRDTYRSVDGSGGNPRRALFELVVDDLEEAGIVFDFDEEMEPWGDTP